MRDTACGPSCDASALTGVVTLSSPRNARDREARVARLPGRSRASDPPSDITDAALIVRVLAGDVSAYATLVDRHYDSCARFARRMLGNGEDADDVLQETLLQAFQALRRYHERDRFGAWLFRILSNRCRTHLRQRTRRSRRFVQDDTAVAVTAGPPPEAERLRDTLQRALDALDPRSREALLLKYGEALDYDEISRLTGSSVSALKMRVKRAREAVRPLLEAMLNE